MQETPRILVVDDDQTNLRFLNEVLKDDYDLLTVATGEEALEEIDRFKPGIVLLDIMLPGIDGYEVCREIRKNSNFSKIKIILISAKAMANEKQKGYEAGGDAYITKPFDHLDLMAAIKQMI